MSRGGLLLRRAADGAELDYVPVAGAVRHGARPPKLAAAQGVATNTCASSIPRDQDNVVLTVERKEVRLTNLRKVFWPELGLTKGDLLQYYADVAAVLLPHIGTARW